MWVRDSLVPAFLLAEKRVISLDWLKALLLLAAGRPGDETPSRVSHTLRLCPAHPIPPQQCLSPPHATSFEDSDPPPLPTTPGRCSEVGAAVLFLT